MFCCRLHEAILSAKNQIQSEQGELNRIKNESTRQQCITRDTKKLCQTLQQKMTKQAMKLCRLEVQNAKNKSIIGKLNI